MLFITSTSLIHFTMFITSTSFSNGFKPPANGIVGTLYINTSFSPYPKSLALFHISTSDISSELLSSYIFISPPLYLYGLFPIFPQ
ncbi:hypothetical protein ACJW30_03G106500 [Castanea mollissima]